MPPAPITPATFATQARRPSERGAAAAARGPDAAATPPPRTVATRKVTKSYERDGTEWYKADAGIVDGEGWWVGASSLLVRSYT